MSRLRGAGAAWGALKAFLASRLPSTLDDRDEVAFHLVPTALTAILGPRGEGWHTFKNERNTTYVQAGPE